MYARMYTCIYVQLDLSWKSAFLGIALRARIRLRNKPYSARDVMLFGLVVSSHSFLPHSSNMYAQGGALIDILSI